MNPGKQLQWMVHRWPSSSPPLDPAVAEALDAYVRRRREEIARQDA